MRLCDAWPMRCRAMFVCATGTRAPRPTNPPFARSHRRRLTGLRSACKPANVQRRTLPAYWDRRRQDERDASDGSTASPSAGTGRALPLSAPSPPEQRTFLETCHKRICLWARPTSPSALPNVAWCRSAPSGIGWRPLSCCLLGLLTSS